MWSHVLLSLQLRNSGEARSLDRQKDEALVDGRQVSSDRSHLLHMAGAEKLCAALRQVPAHHDEVGPQSILGLLDELTLVQKGAHFRLAPMSEMSCSPSVDLRFSAVGA